MVIVYFSHRIFTSIDLKKRFQFIILAIAGCQQTNWIQFNWISTIFSRSRTHYVCWPNFFEIISFCFGSIAARLAIWFIAIWSSWQIQQWKLCRSISDHMLFHFTTPDILSNVESDSLKIHQINKTNDETGWRRGRIGKKLG